MATMTLDQLEEKLAKRYRGKLCSFSYPGYDTVYGRVDEISVNTARLPTSTNTFASEFEIIIILNDKRYTCDLQGLKECLQTL